MSERDVLAKLILHLDGWAKEMFYAGDFSDAWGALRDWARQVTNEEQKPPEEA